MSADNDFTTPPHTVEIDVAQLLSPGAAARQKSAFEHATEALRLVDELLELEEVKGTHRCQLLEGQGFLEEALVSLGSVVEFAPPAETYS
jgi:hypothetical protein